MGTFRSVGEKITFIDDILQLLDNLKVDQINESKLVFVYGVIISSCCQILVESENVQKTLLRMARYFQVIAQQVEGWGEGILGAIGLKKDGVTNRLVISNLETTHLHTNCFFPQETSPFAKFFLFDIRFVPGERSNRSQVQPRVCTLFVWFENALEQQKVFGCSTRVDKMHRNNKRQFLRDTARRTLESFGTDSSFVFK